MTAVGLVIMLAGVTVFSMYDFVCQMRQLWARNYATEVTLHALSTPKRL